MKIKEIHDYLLSLFLRGIGVWLLYEVSLGLDQIVNDLRSLIAPPNNTWVASWWDLGYFLIHLVSAAYFILGAPPFLKWATQGKENSN